MKKQKIIFAFICFLLTAQFSFAQNEPPKDGRFYEREAVKAYQNKDFKAYLENLQMALRLRPNHPRILYNLAGAYNLNGYHEEAALLLNQVANMGLIYPVEKDEDFSSIKHLDWYKSILEKFENNKRPVIRSRSVITIPEKGLIAESVAYDSLTKTFYVSSVHKRKIISINAKGKAKDFATEKDGLWAVLGMKVDAKRRILWACTSAVNQATNIKAEDKGKSGLLKFDLRTGKLLKVYLIPDQKSEHWLGDLLIAANGDVFATDSIKPTVYVLRNGKEEIESFLEHKSFVNLQGLDFSSDERFLFMADYTKGIHIADLKTKSVSQLASPSTMTLLGIDGLYFYKDSLIATQNGVNPQRVVRFFLSKDMKSIERMETLEANHAQHDDITLGMLMGNNFYYIPNSQWWAISNDGKLASEDKLKEPIVLTLNLMK